MWNREVSSGQLKKTEDLATEDRRKEGDSSLADCGLFAVPVK
jgi:hypothetical protein